MKFYHGAKNKIDRFEITNEFMTDDTIMQEGPGIYLTSSIDDARRYGPYIHEIEWRPKKRLPTKKTYYPMEHYRVFLSSFIKKSPDWKENAMNWNENPDKGVREAIESILDAYETPKERFEQIWYDFYRNDPTLFCQNMVRVGYDGFIIEKKNGVKHAIVFNPATIHILNVKLMEKVKYLNIMKLNESIKLLESLSNKKVSLLERQDEFFSDIDENAFTFKEVLDQKKVHIFGLENIDVHLINKNFDVDGVILPIKWKIEFDFKKAGINGFSIIAKVGKIHISLNIWGDGTTDDETKEADLDLSQFDLETELEFKEGNTMYIDQVNIDFEQKKITIQ